MAIDPEELRRVNPEAYSVAYHTVRKARERLADQISYLVTNEDVPEVDLGTTVHELLNYLRDTEKPI